LIVGVIYQRIPPAGKEYRYPRILVGEAPCNQRLTVGLRQTEGDCVLICLGLLLQLRGLGWKTYSHIHFGHRDLKSQVAKAPGVRMMLRLDPEAVDLMHLPADSIDRNTLQL